MPKHVKSASCVTTHNYLLSTSFTANFACSKDERQNQLEKVDSHLSNSKSGRRRSTFSPTINYCFTKSVDMSRSRTTQRFKNTKQFRNMPSSSFVYIIYIIFLIFFWRIVCLAASYIEVASCGKIARRQVGIQS